VSAGGEGLEEEGVTTSNELAGFGQIGGLAITSSSQQAGDGDGDLHATDLLEDGESTTLLSSSTRLFSHSFKSRVLDNLHELSAFLSQRLLEGESQQQSGMGMFFSFQPGSGSESESGVTEAESSLLQSTSLESIRQQMDQVNLIISEMVCKEVGRLDLLRSPRSLQKMMRQLEQKQAQEGKYESMMRGVKARREDLQRQSIALKPKLKALVAHTQRVKRAIENAISSQYENRPVHVIGQINTVLVEASAF
jgi:hypothetical protein